jgi:acetyl esterase
MPLDEYLTSRLHLIEGIRPEQLGDPEVWARLAEFGKEPGDWREPAVAVEDRTVAGPHGPVPVRLYGRHDASRALLWLHGGGFHGGSVDMPEAHVVATELAARADALVASVDYRLATGGVRYPVPLDDVQAAWRWFTEFTGAVSAGEGSAGAGAASAGAASAGAASAGAGSARAVSAGAAPAGAARPGVRVAIGGASAGAALALATAIRERDGGGRLADGLLLAYPFAHFPNPALDGGIVAEMAALPPVLRVTADSVEFMVRNYVGRISGVPAEALPGAAPLHGLPPAHIIVCEYDDLRASAELLARQLTEAGVTAETHLATGMPHGHLNRTPALPETDRSLGFFAAALRPER